MKKPRKPRSDRGTHAKHVLAGVGRCACGQPATRTRGSAFVCDRCHAIERRMHLA